MKNRPFHTCMARRGNAMSPGVAIICLIAVVTLTLGLFMPVPVRTGLEMWTFAVPHQHAYQPVLQHWNLNNQPVNMYVLSIPALRSRMLAGFLSDTPLADLIEADVNIASHAFTGPIEDVGFVDLTNWLQEEGIFDKINKPSFSPWTSRGRVFGLPHDVHPVMLCYRADLVEQAGIEMADVKTWDDFAQQLRPLIADTNGDGRTDRYLLNLWHQHMDSVEALILQGGGAYFDENEKVIIDSEINAQILCKIVTWLTGPNRIAIDAEEFQPSGNKLKLDGRVIASLMPDWLAGIWKRSLPQLEGKLKLMPLPAWKLGGRRTSVWGGSMIGIARSSANVDQAWRFAKKLYLSKSAAQRLYETNRIISPLKELWPESFYDVPDPYFSQQSPGRMYIELAPDVPLRTSSTFNKFAKEEIRTTLVNLKRYANYRRVYDIDGLLPEARLQLRRARDSIRRRINHNAFLRDAP